MFTRTKHGANKLAEYLSKHDIPAAAIHGNKSQAARTRALAQFKDGSLPVLVATDIAARGLDIDQLPQVVNFELPNVPEDYVHRIGRTGRAGAAGHAISLVDREELKLLTAIERLIKRRIERATAEDFVPSAGAEAAHDADHRREPLQRRGGGRPGQSQGRAASGDAARGGNRGNGGRSSSVAKTDGRTQPRAHGDVDGNRRPAPRPDVDGNRGNSGRAPGADGNRAPHGQGRGTSGRPAQRPALFAAKPGSGNR